MNTANFLIFSVILLTGSGFYLYKLEKIENEKKDEKKEKLYKYLNTKEKSAAIIIFLLQIVFLYRITIADPRQIMFEFIMGSAALIHTIKGYFEGKYFAQTNRHKASFLNAGFFLFLLMFSVLRSFMV